MLQENDPHTTSRRTYDLEGGNKIHVERKNPFGFIRAHFDKGAIPESLDSDYTSYDEADKAVKIYLASKGKAVLKVTSSHDEEAA